MWGAAAANFEYLDGVDGDRRRMLEEGLVFKRGGAKGRSASSQQQQQQQLRQEHFHQHASPDTADAMSCWFNGDALLLPGEQLDALVIEPVRPHTAAAAEAEGYLSQLTPVKRELKLSIELPSQMESRVGDNAKKSGRGSTATSGDHWHSGEEDRAALLGAVDGRDAHDPYLHLSPRSRRKRKNRDQMRQARQKEKETMQKLRDTVERLEATYIQVTKEKEAFVAAVGNGSIHDEDAQYGDAALRFPYRTSYTQSSTAGSLGSLVATTTSCGASTSSSVQYSELMSAASRLKEENFRLKQTLHEKHKLRETLERHFSDFCEASPASVRDGIQHMSVDRDDDASSEDYYVPMTTEESWILIRDTHERVHAVQQSIAKRAQEANDDVSQPSTSSSKPSYCGWQIQYHTQDGVLLFAFEKPFYHVTALQAMEKMWTNERAMQSYRSAHDAANQTLKIVQHINDDTYVFQRRMRVSSSAPSATSATTTTTRDKLITTTYIRFRLKTARGYLVGQKSIDKDDIFNGRSSTTTITDDAEGEDQVHWASKLCLWTEFIQEYTPSGHEYCVVRPSGFTNLQSGELNGRVVAETIIHLLRWESMTIGPVFTLSSE